MHKNYFDIVMAHIEENVNKSTADIKREIANLIGRHSRSFNEHFNMLTGYTLDYYIKQRRLNYAAKDLVICRDKTISDIALEYQFYDQSAFSRAIKDKYGVTPNEIRKEGLWLFEDRFYFDAFSGKKADTNVAKLLRSLEVGGPNCQFDFNLMIEIEQLNDVFGFDIDTCYQIADLAERLDIPLQRLAEYCAQAAEETKPDETEEILAMLSVMNAFQIDSEEELDAICTYYKCEYYELDQLKVYQYRKSQSK